MITTQSGAIIFSLSLVLSPMQNKSKSIIFSFLLLGFLLSIYALYVEYKALLDDSYEAFCDISAEISCSKVFLSEYGKVFSKLGIVPKDSLLDQPNALYGSIFYVIIGFFIFFFSENQVGKLIILGLSTLSMVLCAYLSYILTEILQDKCIICFSTYICNFAIFLYSVYIQRNSVLLN